MIDPKNAKLSAPPDVGGGGTLQGLFASNHIAMTIGGGFWAAGSHGWHVADRVRRAVFPGVEGAEAPAGRCRVRDAQVLEKQGDGRWEFMKSLTAPAALGAQLLGNTSTPTRRSMMTASRYAPTGPDHWQVFYGTLDKYPNTTPIPAPPYYQQMATAFTNATTQAMSSGNAKAALDGLQTQLEGFASSSST